MRPYKSRSSNPTRFAHRPVATRTVAIASDAPGDPTGVDNDALDRQLEKYLRYAAEIIAEYARRAAAKFSKRIPGTVAVDKDHAVHVKAGGPVAPNAYPFDPPSSPPLWHPVFPKGPREHWHWAPQPYKPFLEEAAAKGGEEAANKFADIVDEWAKEIGTDRP